MDHVQRINGFASDLFSQLPPAENAFFSPHSVWRALAMVHDGAAGQTARQLRDALRLEGITDAEFALIRAGSTPATTAPDKTYVLHTANATWVDNGLSVKPEYAERVRRLHGGEVNKVDFVNDSTGAARTINGWVRDRTESHIPTIVDSLSPTVGLVLANAIYFKGKWRSQFTPSNTRPDTFRTRSNALTTVQMMHNSSVQGRYLDGGDFAVAEIQYHGGASFCVAVPRDVAGIARHSNTMLNILMDPALGGARGGKIDLYLPKFTCSTQYELPEALSRIGITDAFSLETADFSLLANEALYVSDVRHRARVDVNEEGTEAAAATAVYLARAMGIHPIPVIRVDRPSLYAIKDVYGAALFLGRLENPAA